MKDPLFKKHVRNLQCSAQNYNYKKYKKMKEWSDKTRKLRLEKRPEQTLIWRKSYYLENRGKIRLYQKNYYQKVKHLSLKVLQK